MSISRSQHSTVVLVFLTAVIGLVVPASAEPVVSFILQSPQQSETITTGSTVDWTISVTASTGDNLGLALACCDLVADGGNPTFFDIPPAEASTLPPSMLNFDRPAGITNPGEGGSASGFVGVQRGEPGHMNLIQIGGAQNTAGQALPTGTGVGESAEVVQGIGQDAEPQVLAAGSFTAPSTPGTYTFRIENGLANVLTNVPPTPEHATVARADIDLTANEFSFVVSEEPPPGDLNCDGYVTMADINAFVLALTDPPTYATTYDCDITLADLNSDDLGNGKDIQLFTDILCTLPE